MAEVTAKMVKELRECTGAGMMDCKAALQEAGGDTAKAVDILRTKGLADLAKRAGRATNEGVVATWISDDAKVGAIVEVNCETDFVARNETFHDFATEVAMQVAKGAPADVDALRSQTIAERDHTVEEVLGEMVGKLGENMGIARLQRREVAGDGAIGSYVHGGGRLGVLVQVGLAGVAPDAVKGFVRDVAMHVAAAAPLFTRREEVPAELVEHERGIYMAQAAETGKPEQIQAKIAEGRLEKFYKEVCLPEQPFVKDPEITVGRLAERVSQETGGQVSLVGFTRFVLGETAGGRADTSE